MKFRIGPWEYRVVITDGPIFDQNGVEQAGECVWEHHQIRISGTIPVQRRVDALMHELRHAWCFHMGRPFSAEDDANSTSSFSTMAMRELYRQGGEPALMRMTPLGSLERSPAAELQLWNTPSAVSGAECGGCGTRFAASSIVNSIPRNDDLTGRLILTRSIYCDHCGHVQEWIEGAAADGRPNGQVLSAPLFRRGEAATEFLREHGDKAGFVLA